LENHCGNPLGDPPNFSCRPELSRLDVQGVIFDEIRTINRESYVSIEASNADVRIITAKWREFYRSQKDELYEY